jgi:hypothetical protein
MGAGISRFKAEEKKITFLRDERKKGGMWLMIIRGTEAVWGVS